jgi:L-lactate dehydrogenase complex protein LldG
VEDPVMSEARLEILRRVRQALGDVPPAESPDDVRVDRSYLTTDPDPDHRVDRFVERVSEYRAKVHRVEAGALIQAIAAACDRRGVKKLVVPLDVPDPWIPAGVTAMRDQSLTDEQLNESDGVLTGCALGIAQTGTIILDRGPAQGRRALTLLPDYHLCVIREDQIVGMVPEAVAALRESAGTPGRPMTWISGPSATSDIELSRVEGVHGPRTLEVLVVSRTD